MAMSAVYTNFGGRMVHEKRGGASRRYASDPLGSLAAVLQEETLGPVYAAEYWPYGEIQTEFGANPSPWGFVGLLGYYKDLASLLYVRARHYLTDKGRWLTVDPLWPNEQAYGYVGNMPSVGVDYDGASTHVQMPWEPKPKPMPNPGVGPSPVPSPCASCICWNRFVFEYCNACYKRNSWFACQLQCSAMADWYYRACKGPRPYPPYLQPWRPQNPSPTFPPSQIVPDPFPPGPPCIPPSNPWNAFGPPVDCDQQLRDCPGTLDPLGICSSGATGYDYDPFCRFIYGVCMLNYAMCQAANGIRAIPRL